MKTERIQFLVTVSVTYDQTPTPSDRRAAVKEAKETIQCSSGGVYRIKHKRATLVKKPRESYH